MEEIANCTLDYNGTKTNLQLGSRYVIYLTSSGALGLDRDPSSQLKEYRIRHCSDSNKEPDKVLINNVTTMYDNVAIEADLTSSERVKFRTDDRRDQCRMMVKGRGASETTVSLPDDTKFVSPSDYPYEEMVVVNQGLGNTYISFDITFEMQDGASGDVEETISSSTETQTEDTGDFEFVGDDSNDVSLEDDRNPQEIVREALVNSKDDRTVISKLSDVAVDQNYSTAIEIKQAMEQGHGKLVDYIMDNENVSGLGKILAGVLGHAVRKIIEESESVGDFEFALNTYQIEDNWPIESSNQNTVGELKKTLKQIDEDEATVGDITTDYGLRQAVQRMVQTDVTEESSSQSTETTDQTTESDTDRATVDPLEVGLSEEESMDATSASTQAVGAATPGQGEVNDINFDQRQENILQEMVKADNIDEAISSIERLDDYEDGGQYPIDSDSKITFEQIRDTLRKEERAPNGHHMDQELSSLNNLDKRFLPVIRSLIVSEVIRQAATSGEAAYKLGKRDAQYDGRMMGGEQILMQSGDLISCLDPGIPKSQMTLEELAERVSDLGEDYAEGGLPDDGGIRTNARNLSFTE